MKQAFSRSLDGSARDINLCVVGLGYVGLPLAVEFGKKFKTIGFDINKKRLASLADGIDATLEMDSSALCAAKYLSYTSDVNEIRDSNIYIVTVPTPINEHKQPDLTPLIKASGMIGSILSPGDLVIYESTVYPGATEEDCVPILEEKSGLIFNKNFYVGYSPERINPGDKQHTLTTILKVTSGSNVEVADMVDSLYSSIISAGTFKASSIKVAEAAKVIENTQRDVNIGLINELAMIFDKLGIDTEEVLKAAETKWNFLPFRPGLVGGHCIGVDPYYLTHKAQSEGLHPEIILAGRRINDNMADYVAAKLVKAMLHKSITIKNSRILVLGFTFKENCPDVRNTKVIDVIRELKEYGTLVDCYDPWVSSREASCEYGIETIGSPKNGVYDAVIIAVAHDTFKDMGIKALRRFGKPTTVILDLKYLFPKCDTDVRL